MSVVPSALGEPMSEMAMLRPTAVPGAPCAFKGNRAFFHAGTGSVGVVLCAPWGYEDLAMRKSWRLLAEAVAAAGFPTLRFDYPGTGNSLGTMGGIVDVAQWVRSIGDAADFLRAYSGVKRFVFIGQSLGATLAAAAAALRTDVVGLQLIAPVVKGRAYARELSVTTKIAADRVGITIDLEPGEGMNVLGFSLSQPLLDSLKALDLTKSGMGGVRDVVVYDQADRKAGAEASEHFRRNGVPAVLTLVPPYHLMESNATTIQALPATAAQVVASLTSLYPTTVPPLPARVPLLPATMRCGTFKEEPLRFGADEALRGTLCLATHPQLGAPAVIFLNRGLNAQIGWGRVSVDHARALAAAGMNSLRIDETGLGESPDTPQRPEPLIYADALAADIRAAVDVFAARGHARIALVGVCSGAYTALLSAANDPRVTDLVAINAQRLVWNPAESVEDVMRYGLRSMTDYVGDIRAGVAFRKLLKGRRRIIPAVRFLVKRAVATVVARLPLEARTALARDSMAGKVLRLFSTFSQRGTRVSLVYSALDPGPLRELATYFGPGGRNLRMPNITISIIPDSDHNLTTTQAANWLRDHLVAMGQDATPAEPPVAAPRDAVAAPRGATRMVCSN